MARLFIEYLGCDKIYNCKKCWSPIVAQEQLVSKVSAFRHFLWGCRELDKNNLYGLVINLHLRISLFARILNQVRKSKIVKAIDY